jgi:transcriptional regulator with GAF, ATPase, and Fis domain
VQLAGIAQPGQESARALRLAADGAADIVFCSDAAGLCDESLARLVRLREILTLARSRAVRERVVGASAQWDETLERVVEAAIFSDSSFTLTGESGTGKDLLARLIHDISPRRKEGPFVVVDCTTLRGELMGSELFGHARGAFTNAINAREGAIGLADGGTLFLDEIGELDPPLQAQLLRVIQEHVYKRVGEDTWRRSDFRLVCATNRNLVDEVRDGRFRRDLYYRVTQCTLRLPALRERREDIPALVRHFLAQSRGDASAPAVAPEVLQLLAGMDFPGNVRELRNLVLRMHDRQRGFRQLSIGALPRELRPAPAAVEERWRGELRSGIEGALSGGVGLSDLKRLVAQISYQVALDRSGGSAGEAARIVQQSRRMVEHARSSQRRG